jgi:hypothetical protein
MSESRIGWLGALVTAAILSASSVSADQLNCDLGGYAAAPGLTAAVEHDTLTVVWDGDNRQSLRMRFVISAGTPTSSPSHCCRRSSARRSGMRRLRCDWGQWVRVAAWDSAGNGAMTQPIAVKP